MKKSIILITFIIFFINPNIIFSITTFNQIEYSTYFGGFNKEIIRGVAAYPDGGFVIVGHTESINLPVTANAYQKTIKGATDIFVARFDKDNDLLWSTYLGSPSNDGAFNIVVDKTGNIWISGESTGSGFPVTADAYQKGFAGGSADCILSKFSADGNLLYSTYFGGSSYEGLVGLAVDDNNSIWGSSQTLSINLPLTANAFQTVWGGYYDGFIVKFGNDGKLLLSSLFGGDWDDGWDGIVIADDGNPVVGGWTQSTNLLSNAGLKKGLTNETDFYIAKLDKNTARPIWGAYFGGSDFDRAYCLAKAPDGSFALSGVVNSTNFPVSSNAFQTKLFGQSDYAVVKVDEDGNYLWSTFLGGSSDEGYQNHNSNQGGLIFDRNNTLIMSGFALSNFPVTPDALIKVKYSSSNAFISAFNVDGSLIYSSYLGGKGSDLGYGLTIDIFDKLIAVGTTNSPDFPVTSSCYQGNLKGDYDGYIVKFGSKLVINDSCDDTEFNFPEFSDVTDLVFKGFSFKKDKYLRVCPARDNYVGSIWYRYYVPIKNGFRTNFKFCMTKGENHGIDDRSLPGADGIAFVIQNISTDMSGISGGRMGYDPLPNSLAVEFDLYSNDSLQIENLYDPNGNHIAVFSNGTNPNSANHKSSAHKGSALAPFVMKSDSTIYFAQIEYKPASKELDVYLSLDSTFRSPVLTIKNIDIASLIKLDKDEFAYVGFTSATGQSFQNHDILAWTFCPVQTDGVPSFVESGEVNSQKSAFPNPADDWVLITILYSGNQLVKLEIFDLMGKKYDVRYELINNGDSNDLKLSVQNLKKGIYFLKANQGTSVKIYKFIKN